MYLTYNKTDIYSSKCNLHTTKLKKCIVHFDIHQQGKLCMHNTFRHTENVSEQNMGYVTKQ